MGQWNYWKNALTSAHPAVEEATTGKNVCTGIHNHYPFELQHLGEPDRSFENQTVLRTPIGRMIDASVILNVTTTVGFLDQRLIYCTGEYIQLEA